MPMNKPWTVSVQVTDNKRKRSTHKLYLKGEWTVTEVETYLSDYVAKLAVLLDGKITKISLSREMDLPAGIPAFAHEVSDVEVGLKVKYRTFVFKYFTNTLPTYKDAYLLPPSTWDGLRKPTFDPEVTALFNMMTIAPTLGYASNPTDSRGVSMDIIMKRYQYIKKSR